MKIAIFLFLNISLFAQIKISPMLYSELSRVDFFVERGEYKKAKEIFDKIEPKLNKDDDIAYFYYNLAYLNIEREYYKDAIKNFKRVIELNRLSQKDSEQVKFDLSKLLIYDKEFKEAEKILKELIVKYPKNYKYWSYLRDTALSKESYIEAISIYESMYHLNLLNKTEIVKFTNLLAYLKSPYRAYLILEREISKNSSKELKERLNLYLIASKFKSN